MNTLEFLSYLRSLEVKLSADGGRLRLSAPKGVLTPTLQAELSERKAEILSFLQNANLASGSTLSLLPVPRDKDLPLSFAQQRLWFLEQLELGTSAYNMPEALWLKGVLNVAALEQSLGEIVRRHEILRTTFVTVEGQATQVISPAAPLTLLIVDLQDIPHSDQAAQTKQRATQEGQQPFDLAHGPLWRFKLLRLAPEEHLLLLTIHHIVFDGWSFDVFFQELAELYKAFCSGEGSLLPELPIQYADFAHWQRQWLQGEVLESQLGYWKQQLGGSLPVLQLPTDRPQVSDQTTGGSYQSLLLPKELTQGLKALSHQEGVTLFMTVLAAFKTLLYRHTGQEDIIVGSPIAGRNRSEIEGLLGLFLNMLALRTDLSGNPSFQELLKRVRHVTLGAYAHQDLPFDKLVEELHPERNPNRHPLFDVMVNFFNTPETAWELPELTLSPFQELTEPDAKFWMSLYVEDRGNELNLKLVYQRSLFEAQRIADLLNQFEYLLEQVVAAPAKPIRSYSLVTSSAQALLPNPSAVLLEPHHEPITNLFTSWVKRTPEQPAICQSQSSWSYSQLSESATALARMLIADGVEQGEVVAVLGSRSFGLIASMMGVLLSGGVLLTIDPNLPWQRQQLMLQEAKAKRLLYVEHQPPTDQQRWDSLAVLGVAPDTGRAVDGSKTTGLEAINLPELSPEDAAYIFFTSGTTGVPKGVLGCHKGLSHFLSWQRETFGVRAQDRSGQLTGLSFDVVLRDIFLPLTSGATLCLPADTDDLSAARILPWLERQQITQFHTVPSLAQSWLADLPPGVSLCALRRVFFAGEPLTDTLVGRWREAFPKAGEIVNLYGPTETTLAKCCYRVPAEPLPGVQSVGKPLPQTQALILGENNQLCGIGEPGEIVIRTPFRSLGYINASPENQQRFFSNPWHDEPQDLLYRTGDRGRYRPDGTLEILGRLDNQVKIRGVRIEPGEISTVLGQHPAIREGVVVAREDNPGDKRLMAYVVSKTEQVLTTSELRSFLKQKLPEYMVPSAFVMLEALPLTPNGKLDRRALPAPDTVRQELEETFVAPRDELEVLLTRIWEKVLNVQPIGMRDNFFELGGHSLLAVRLLNEIEKVFGKQLLLSSFFETQTVEQLANRLRQKDWSALLQSLVIIQPGTAKPPFFCVHAIWGNVLFYRELVSYLEPDQPFYGLQAQGLDGKQAPLTSVPEMAAHYIKEIQIVQPKGPYFIGGYSFGGTVALEIAQQLHTQGHQVALLAIFDSAAPDYQKYSAAPDYQKSSSGSSYPESTFWERQFFHLRKLSRLRLKAQLIYVGERVMWHLMAGKLSIFYRTYLRYIRRSLQDLRLLKVMKANHQAQKSYVAQVYPGRLTFFQANEKVQGLDDESQSSWVDLADGEMEIHEVPGCHTTVMHEPNVQVLAKKLTACLKRAQTADL